MKRQFFCAVVLLCAAMPFIAHADSAADRAKLEAKLAQLETEIDQNKAQLDTQKAQRASLERDLAILDSQVATAQLELQQRDLTIQQISDDIDDKQNGIQGLDQEVSQGQVSIAAMMRQLHEKDDLSLVEIALNGNYEDMMREEDDFEVIQRAVRDQFSKMATTRTALDETKRALEDQQQEEQDLRQLQVLQQQSLKKTEQDKKNLVVAARGQEAIYLQIIANKQESASEIKSELFSLRDTKSVSFGDMYKYAQDAGVKTGVRPAVILAILAEESNLGTNIGKGNWRTDMHPTRDAPVFLQICTQLGLDPDTTPVSKKPWYGWGGAMGPAQFIPSTWQEYAGRISALTNQDPPNPFDARTAVFAAAMLMGDNGADAQTPATERLAAQRYLAGWKNASKKEYSFYGDEVTDLAAKFDKEIAVLGS